MVWNQWDLMLSGLLFAYRNTPHESSGEKPSFLAFGVDPRTPPETTWMSSAPLLPTDLNDYQEQLIGSLSSALELAATQIQAAQCRYKCYYNQGTKETSLRVDDWVLIHFPTYNIPGMASTSSQASTTRMLLSSKCTQGIFLPLSIIPG